MQNTEKIEERKNVCICFSIYPLLQYLLLFDVDTVFNNTIFFLGSGGIPKYVSENLPSYYYNTKPAKGVKEKILRVVLKLKLRLFKNIKYSFLKNAKFYAQDFGYLSILIGKHSYALLSEASNHLSVVYNKNWNFYKERQEKVNSLKGKIECFLYGPLATHYHGDNEQCREFFLTEENDAYVLHNKIVHVDSLVSLWNNSTKEKKQKIYSVFGVQEEDVKILNSKSVVFFTQPLIDDRLCTEESYIELLNDIFNNYDLNDFLIKIHPRDTFPYKKYFPNIATFSKSINMQLLVVNGVSFKKAVTMWSTAIDILPIDVEIDWFGIPHHKLIKQLSPMEFPYQRPYNKMVWNEN